MRADLVSAIKTLLTATGKFSTVCGMTSDTADPPIARVWYQGAPAPNKDNSPQARLEASIGVQIETILKKDSSGNSLDGPLYDLVDAAFNALHNIQLPAVGVQPLIVYDAPGLHDFNEKTDGGPAKYLLTVTARVIPATFALTT